MARKIDIELTSARPDGTWTWRVAGAKQPKGVLDGPILPEGSKVGDVLRAEAEFELEGTTITSVQPVVAKRPEPERLQLLTDSRPFEPVTTSLVPKGARPSRDRRPRPEGPDRDRGRPSQPLDRSDRPERPERGDRPARSDRPQRGPGAGADRRPSADRGARPDRPGPTEGAPRPDRPERGSRPDRPTHGPRGDADRSTRRSSGPGRDRPAGTRQGEGTETHGEHSASGSARPKRLNPGSAHRNAVLDSLPPEERAIAEQLLQGGIPAVRRAMQEQNAKARADGRPEVQPDALLALAEELLPRLKGAEWRDRAEAAAKDIGELNLRDLRSILAGADAGARDDESRILAKTLREALEARETAQRDAWIAEIATNLDEGKVTRALRVAGRPPDPRTRFPAELMQRLGDSASAAMTPETPPDRWTALLAAVLDSPVRRAVKPVGLPATPGDALVAAARQASGRIPALASLLGLEMPPPPGPRRPGSRPVPPPPPRAARAQSPARAPASEPAGEALLAQPPADQPSPATDADPADQPSPATDADPADQPSAATDAAPPADQPSPATDADPADLPSPATDPSPLADQPSPATDAASAVDPPPSPDEAASPAAVLSESPLAPPDAEPPAQDPAGPPAGDDRTVAERDAEGAQAEPRPEGSAFSDSPVG